MKVIIVVTQSNKVEYLIVKKLLTLCSKFTMFIRIAFKPIFALTNRFMIVHEYTFSINTA